MNLRNRRSAVPGPAGSPGAWFRPLQLQSGVGSLKSPHVGPRFFCLEEPTQPGFHAVSRRFPSIPTEVDTSLTTALALGGHMGPGSAFLPPLTLLAPCSEGLAQGRGSWLRVLPQLLWKPTPSKETGGSSLPPGPPGVRGHQRGASLRGPRQEALRPPPLELGKGLLGEVCSPPCSAICWSRRSWGGQGVGRGWVCSSVNSASATCPPGLLSPSFLSLTLQLKWGGQGGRGAPGQGLPTQQWWGQKAPLPPLPLLPMCLAAGRGRGQPGDAS